MRGDSVKSISLIAAFILAIPSAGLAEEMAIELEPQNSSITFVLKATLHSVHGNADATSGSLALDTESGDMSGEVVVDSASADTGNTSRDKKMHAKVLRTADHPRIAFRPHRLEGVLSQPGVNDVVVHGEMEILGRSHEIAIPLRIEIGDGRFVADGRIEVPYVEWGLEDPSTLLLKVAKAVDVTVRASGFITPVDRALR
jgi:polyisoprenoid-binding protein YceI